MTNSLKNKLWVEKYKPLTLSNYIFQNTEHENIINNAISQNLPGHILLSGDAGTGKTSLSNLIISTLNIDPIDVLKINASDENSVDIIRNKILNFITIVPNGDFRIVQLEEADYLTPNAQAALRQILEEYVDHAKFILTCNYVHKIIPALKSRMNVEVNFKTPDKTKIAKKVIDILLTENINFQPDLVFKYIDICYPDMRKTLQTLQQHCVDNVLLNPTNNESNSDYKFKFLELIEKDNWQESRELICSQVTNDETESVYRFLYENLSSSKKFKEKENWEIGQVKIAEYLYKDGLVWDREINLSALIIELGMI